MQIALVLDTKILNYRKEKHDFTHIVQTFLFFCSIVKIIIANSKFWKKRMKDVRFTFFSNFPLDFLLSFVPLRFYVFVGPQTLFLWTSYKPQMFLRSLSLSRSNFQFNHRSHSMTWIKWADIQYPSKKCRFAAIILIATHPIILYSIIRIRFNIRYIYTTHARWIQWMPIQFDPFNSFRSWFYNLNVRLLWKRNRIYFIKQMYKKIHQEQKDIQQNDAKTRTKHHNHHHHPSYSPISSFL